MENPTQLESLHEELKAKRPLQLIVVAVYFVLISSAAQELNGFGHLLPDLSVRAWAAISIVGGAFTLAIFYPRHWYVGLLPGAVMGSMAFFAVYYYSQNRSSVYSSELLLVGVVASVPAAIVYYVMLKRSVLGQG